ncbi:MAG: efflux RND transporter periplasmic adaptor subunit [Paenibacillaceae bacterium]|nr:efflux RND transporter periplasmic adaptor subunit [Paenibacillaceae bacterium]
MFMKWRTARLLPVSAHARLIALAAAAVFLFAAVAGCGLLPQAEEAETIPPVVPPKISQKPAYEVKSGTIEQLTKGTGKLMSLAEEELYFVESGRRISDLFVKSGDTVKAGDPIAQLDMGDLDAQIRQKEIQLLMAQEDVKQTMRSAGNDGSDGALATRTKLDYELKQEDLNRLKETLREATIRAPFDGTIVSVHAKKGDMASAYGKIAVIADYSRLTVAAQFGSDDLKRLAVGMKATVEINTAGRYEGTIAQMPSATAEAGSDTIDSYVVVRLDKLPDGVSRGTPLTVSVVTQRKEQALIVPSSVLRTHAGQTYVVVDDNGSKHEANVEVGIQTATEAEIASGLTAGQKVVGK